ncbi:biliverdin-producing heme oxygenase [Desulfovibrio inopinatus]|uniref:biliverdin-producing heme oxygenase n=1 Tax=Desulfovibrio inopinatus TaxID=102109 RepID=UPI00041ED7BE|nr:biliverdin-producing heme oxygenase [Desulfovibrio inopinatus]
MTVHPPLSDQLRSALVPLHAQLQAVPYCMALVERRAPLSVYITHLRVWAMVFAVVESGLDRADNPLLADIWFDEMRRLPLLFTDIDYFRDVPPRLPLTPDPVRVMTLALNLVSNLRKDAMTQPVSLLGVLYVLEGVALGAKNIGLALTSGFGLTPQTGMAYFAALKDDGALRFENFKRRLDAAPLSSRDRELVVQAAMDFIGECIDIFSLLIEPESEGTGQAIRYLAVSLNPEAGNHPICQDEQEITAVMQASVRCLVDYPYLIYRFGTRGRRFLDSDGAWLVHLTNLETKEMLSQVLCFGQSLTSRGIPQLLLEHHLRMLHRELRRVLPENQERYEKLIFCADHMRRHRRELLSEDVIDALTSDFCNQTGLYGNFAAKEAAELIIAGVLDEAQGLENATDSLMPWLADPMRRPAPWIKTVRITMDRANRAIVAKKARHEHIA